MEKACSPRKQRRKLTCMGSIVCPSSSFLTCSSYLLLSLSLSLSRARASESQSPPRKTRKPTTTENDSYYAQRATAGGLLISEATNVCPGAQGYPNTPGIWNEAQVQAWKPVTSAVKKAATATGATAFFLQLWHTGRVSSSKYQPDGRPPPSASATKCESEGGVTLPDFSTVPYETARALEVSEIEEIVNHYGAAARNAVAAGFDGVEVHLANGYLPEQFLRLSSNKRDDGYGAGSFDSRARFALEIVRAAAEGAGGAEAVGVRLSPFGKSRMGSADEDAVEFYVFLVKELEKLGIAYAHVVETRMTDGNKEAENWDRSWSIDPLRRAWHAAVEGEKGEGKAGQNANGGTSSSSSPYSSGRNRQFIAAGGFNRKRALEHMEKHPRDLIAFGRFWLSTPDLPARLKADKPLNQYHRDSFYIPDVVKGYTDYPTLEQIEADIDTYKVKEHYDGSKTFVLKEKK